MAGQGARDEGLACSPLRIGRCHRHYLCGMIPLSGPAFSWFLRLSRDPGACFRFGFLVLWLGLIVCYAGVGVGRVDHSIKDAPFIWELTMPIFFYRHLLKISVDCYLCFSLIGWILISEFLVSIDFELRVKRILLSTSMDSCCSYVIVRLNIMEIVCNLNILSLDICLVAYMLH